MKQGCRGDGVRAALAAVLASSLPLAADAVRDGLLDADQLYVISTLVEALRAGGRDAAVVASVEGVLVDAAVAEPGASLVPLATDLWHDLAPDAAGVPWDAEPDLLDVSWPASLAEHRPPEPTDPRVPEPMGRYVPEAAGRGVPEAAGPGVPEPPEPGAPEPAAPGVPEPAERRVPELIGAVERGADSRVLGAPGTVEPRSPPSVGPPQQAGRAPDSPRLSLTGQLDPDSADRALLAGATGVSGSVVVPATGSLEPPPRARRAYSDTRTLPVTIGRALVLGRRGSTRGRAPPTSDRQRAGPAPPPTRPAW